MNRLYEATGPDGIIDAANVLLGSDTYDMAAIRGVFKEDDPILSALDDEDNSHNLENFLNLRDSLPQLDIVRGIIAANWVLDGYKDSQISGSFFLDQLRFAGIMPHIDGVLYKHRIEAGLQISLCLKGHREFLSERLDEVTKKEDGTFDRGAYDELDTLGGKLHKELVAGRVPRTSVVLAAGDMVMFPHHPVISLHQVKTLEKGTTARLISYNAEFSNPN